MLGLGFQELKVNAQSTWSAWEAWWWKSLEGPDVSPSKEMGKPSDPGKGRQEPTSRETIQSSSVPLRIESRASVSNETPPAEGILSSIANYRTQPRPGDEQQYQYGLFSYLQRLFPEISFLEYYENVIAVLYQPNVGGYHYLEEKLRRKGLLAQRVHVITLTQPSHRPQR